MKSLQGNRLLISCHVLFITVATSTSLCLPDSPGRKVGIVFDGVIIADLAVDSCGDQTEADLAVRAHSFGQWNMLTHGTHYVDSMLTAGVSVAVTFVYLQLISTTGVGLRVVSDPS